MSPLRSFETLPMAKRLPIMIAAVAGLSAAVTGGIAFLTSAAEVTAKSERLLTGAATFQAESIESFVRGMAADVGHLAAEPEVADAIGAFSAAYAQVGAGAETSLQRTYIDANPNPLGKKDELTAAGDGSSYDATHAQLHPWLRGMQRMNGYYDLFLFDRAGAVVYTVFKERDFASNVQTGRWKETGLGDAYRLALADPSKAHFVDFEKYAPSNDVPAAFMAQAVKGRDGRVIGVVAVQAPIDQINETMRPMPANGKTGESMIVGADGLMRTDSRFKGEESTILATEIQNAALARALKGETGALMARNVRGQDTLIAYRPVEVEGVRWALLSDIEKKEANASLTQLGLQIGLATLALIGLSIGAGLLAARSIVRPVGRLTAAMQTLAGGDASTNTPEQDRKDELGEMARAVEVFRENAIERTRLEAEAEATRTAARKRAEAIEAESAEFERACAQLLDTFAAATTELEATAGAMTGAAGRTATMVTGVSHAAQDATSGAAAAAAAATELEASVAQIRNSVTESDIEVARAAKQAADAADVVSELDRSAAKIGEVIGLIRDVADQTNLLALNATIEAARAGEAGRGFAVVASEVKALAGQTGRATDEIAAQIAAIQSSVSSAVRAIGAIREVTMSLAERSRDVNGAVSEQAGVTSEIARTMVGVSNASSGVTQNVSEVAQTAAETGAAAEQVLMASKDLARQSDQLKGQVERFLRAVKAA